MRPAPIADVQQTTDTMAILPSHRRSEGVAAPARSARQAEERLTTIALVKPRAIAGNFTSKKGFPAYSVPLDASRPMPLPAASRNPAAATGDAASAMAASAAALRERPIPQQGQVDDQHRAEERGNAEDVRG